jgi:hypothetical protein
MRSLGGALPWSAMEAHLEAWTREIADARVHGTVGETPRERFAE